MKAADCAFSLLLLAPYFHLVRINLEMGVNAVHQQSDSLRGGAMHFAGLWCCDRESHWLHWWHAINPRHNGSSCSAG